MWEVPTNGLPVSGISGHPKFSCSSAEASRETWSCPHSMERAALRVGRPDKAQRFWLELYGSFYELGVLFWGPCMRDPLLMGSVFGPLNFGNSHTVDDKNPATPKPHQLYDSIVY